MQHQQYKNHRKTDGIYHFVVYPLLIAILAIAIMNFQYVYDKADCLYEPVLFVLIGLTLPLIALKARGFALRAQDRAIRAEENLRHFALTGKLMDNRLRLGQVIALRFAPDHEFVGLAKRAAEENLSPMEIKKSIQQWRGDYHRV